jgi:hypothetical protein
MVFATKPALAKTLISCTSMPWRISWHRWTTRALLAHTFLAVADAAERGIQ